MLKGAQRVGGGGVVGLDLLFKGVEKAFAGGRPSLSGGTGGRRDGGNSGEATLAWRVGSCEVRKVGTAKQKDEETDWAQRGLCHPFSPGFNGRLHRR